MTDFDIALALSPIVAAIATGIIAARKKTWRDLRIALGLFLLAVILIFPAMSAGHRVWDWDFSFTIALAGIGTIILIVWWLWSEIGRRMWKLTLLALVSIGVGTVVAAIVS